MMKRSKRLALLVLLAALLCTLCACHENPTQEALYEKMFAYFEGHALSCTLQPVEEERPVPIYEAKAWQSLLLDGEEVLVYFDESNRADYLLDFVDEEQFGQAWRFGLRFILVYDGSDPQLLEALNAIVNE